MPEDFTPPNPYEGALSALRAKNTQAATPLQEFEQRYADARLRALAAESDCDLKLDEPPRITAAEAQCVPPDPYALALQALKAPS
jgi:hypothetical protein